ncbi:cytochrome P450 [Scytonema sp. HK-05]|uniref:cytochrome P450 n=1 Tax=Scytonema sp. HK-05 TaxID=1137095 RepID=UPI000936FFB6|nr:cytochrome P450 [Scytonema sp. HK-05]OKH60688.1 hypothetical protein NIES2130_02990 [Scytonema sp. HK-05]BAY46102.1 cytochrome P450 [Scytonema sp. HK-05]
MTTKEIPVAKGLPLIGNIIPLIQNPYQFFVKTYQQLGPLYKVCVPGRVLTVLGGPEANIFVSQTKVNYFSNRETYADFVKELGVSLSVELDGDEHRRYRKINETFYSQNKAEKYVKPMIQAILDVSEKWQLGQRLEVDHLMQQLTCTQVGLAFLSCKVGDYYKDINTYFDTVMKVAQLRIASKQELHKRKYITAKNRTFTFIKTLIEERKKMGILSENPDMLDTLLIMTHDDGQYLTENEIFSFTLSVFFTVPDTVAKTASFLLYEILKNPELHEKVIAEVDVAFANGIPDIEDIKNMKVLRWAAMETLRMYPVGFMLPRYVKHPFDFAGYRVESGQLIYIALGISHFLPQFYPEPYTFDVERYSPLRQEHKQPGAFAPFSFGEHTCTGARLGEIQLMLIVATLLYTVEPEIDPPNYTLKTTVFSKKSVALTAVDFYIKTRSRNPLVSQSSLIDLRR